MRKRGKLLPPARPLPDDEDVDWRDPEYRDSDELTELQALQDRARDLRRQQQGAPPVKLKPAQDRLAENLARSQVGNFRPVTAATVPAGPNNTRVPLDVARVRVDPDLARPWTITLHDVGNIFAFGFDNPIPLLTTQCELRWARRGVDFIARFDWRVGMTVSVDADFVEVSVAYDPLVFQLLPNPPVFNVPDKLNAGATIVEGQGPAAPTIRPTFTSPGAIVFPQAFGGPFPIPLWAYRVAFYATDAVFPPPATPPPRNEFFIEFLSDGSPAPAFTARYRSGNQFLPQPDHGPGIIIPGWATLIRIFNNHAIGESFTTYLGVFELAF